MSKDFLFPSEVEAMNRIAEIQKLFPELNVRYTERSFAVTARVIIDDDWFITWHEEDLEFIGVRKHVRDYDTYATDILETAKAVRRKIYVE